MLFCLHGCSAYMCVHVCICLCLYVCICNLNFICVCICVCICVSICVCPYLCMYKVLSYHFLKHYFRNRVHNPNIFGNWALLFLAQFKSKWNNWTYFRKATKHTILIDHSREEEFKLQFQCKT